MSEDKARLSELQSALRAKMADNKTIADSFKIEDGNVVVSSAQKTAFDKNMQDIKEIKSLISGLEQMSEVDSWGSQASGESVAAAVAAGSAFSHSLRSETIGEAFLNSSEFKSLDSQRSHNPACRLRVYRLRSRPLHTGKQHTAMFSLMSHNCAQSLTTS